MNIVGGRVKLSERKRTWDHGSAAPLGFGSCGVVEELLRSSATAAFVALLRISTSRQHGWVVLDRARTWSASMVTSYDAWSDG